MIVEFPNTLNGLENASVDMFVAFKLVLDRKMVFVF